MAARGCKDSNVHAAPTEPESHFAHQHVATFASASGDMVFHRGQGILHLDFNAGTGDMVACVTFLGIPPGQGATLPAHDHSPC